MLVKYYGLINDEVNKCNVPRHSFLLDELFRFTQPKFLNDKGSESKMLPYFNRFSPADIAWAKKQYSKMQRAPSYVPSEDELIKYHLLPTGLRYGDAFPQMIKVQTGFNSMEEYDENQFTTSVEIFNKVLLEAISCYIGVFSLCKSATNELMWTHYASEGKGIAIIFKEEHQFFKDNPPQEVTYSPEKRAAITYFKGSWRLNGEPIKNYQVSNLSSHSSIISDLLKNGANLYELSQRIMLSKAEKWSYEEEVRIVAPLDSCEKKNGDILKGSFDDSLGLNDLFSEYHEVCLKKIPKAAFDTVVLGYAINERNKYIIIDLIQRDENLKHIKIKQTKHNLYGELELIDVVL
ncbi:DUF2971 domain-containing protein [Aeromonas schubertii]|uniref:DUF2971 domain-containing protein n=1 Tax=Aeromonas schubertii TaxID=652 RepID=UPI001CC59214|nr:DUF2971 domain-containing protein [Aeromonas schubertii]MBZ6071516.1 DUF2971 domain-containing protein [Aeromonas schubertii]